MKLRIACVQNNPIIGQVEANMSRIRSLLSQVQKPDLVVFPELALTGYNFASKESIGPYLHDANADSENVTNPMRLAKEILHTYRCFTVIGYPEVKNGNIYNSAALVGPDGRLISNYHKTHLYSTDEVWGCDENPNKSFEAFKLILDKDYYLSPQHGGPNGRAYQAIVTNLGICMDLNPYKFEAPFNEFEMAMACFQNRTKLIICPMAWLSPASPSINEDLETSQKSDEASLISKLIENQPHCIDVEEGLVIQDSQGSKNGVNAKIGLSQADNKPPQANNSQGEQLRNKFLPGIPSWSTVNYWVLRMFPFLKHPQNMLPQHHYDKVTFVTCNRIGVESDVAYAGSSSIIQFKNCPGNEFLDERNPSLEILGSLPQGQEGVLVRTVEVETEEVTV